MNKFNYQDFVRVTKLEAVTESSKTNETTNTLMGEPWWAEGFLSYDVEIGQTLEMFRIANYNYPGGKFGSFYTSIIEKIDGDKIYTKNSVYLVEKKEFIKENYPLFNHTPIGDS